MQERQYRIGIDARFFRAATGGIGRYTRELIAHLAAIDHVNLYRVFLTPADAKEWTLRQPNFQPVVVDIPHYTFAEQTELLQTLNAEHLDLVHFLNFNHPVLYRRPFVTTLHDLTVYFQPVGRSQTDPLRRKAFMYTLRRSLRSAKRVIAISDFSAADAERHLGIPQTKIDVIYEGGPPATSLPFGNKAMVQEYLGTRDPYFLFVSQWRPHKGIETLLEAFSRFKTETNLAQQLVLTGKPDERILAHSSAGVLAPGFVPEAMLPLLYHNATALVLPSEYEGFGLPVLEAYAYGAPVICAENSSLPEVAGPGALYFATKDSAALAVRLAEIATDHSMADRLIKDGARQLTKFSWERCARQTLETYQRVLEKDA
jgi:glycosyltransferase involved in cell wall biosynthesis